MSIFFIMNDNLGEILYRTTFREAKWKNKEKIWTFLLYSYFFLYRPDLAQAYWRGLRLDGTHPPRPPYIPPLSVRTLCGAESGLNLQIKHFPPKNQIKIVLYICNMYQYNVYCLMSNNLWITNIDVNLFIRLTNDKRILCRIVLLHIWKSCIIEESIKKFEGCGIQNRIK